MTHVPGGAIGSCARLPVGAGQEKPARVGQIGQAVAVEPEAADLIGRAETVLHGAHHPQRGGALALDRKHDVDEVLEGARTGDRAVFGDVADQQGRDPPRLGDGHERAGDLTHLRDAARHALDLGHRDRLHRIDDQQAGLRPARRG